MSEKSIAGLFVMGDGLQQHEQIAALPFATEDALRAFIRAEVRKALEDDAREIATNPAFQPINAHQHRRVEMTEENGLHWRGVLYATNAEPLYTPLSGVCWGCLTPGTDMQWYSRDGRSHLIHKSEECRQLAAEKQESKEHRG